MKENVEEAIDRLEYINIAYDCNNYYSRYDLDCIEILLSDYKRVLKENEELKNQEATARRINELLVQRYSNSIPVSKVKGIIEQLDERIKNPERTSYWASYTISECIGIRRILQDILGKE